MVKWKDTSSFNRYEKDRTPREWTAKVGVFHLTVHRHIHYEPDVWLLSTVPDLFERRELDSKDIEEAKTQSLALVRAACQLTIDAISKDS
jgi:predicted ATPase